ncbi:hypothetical protein KIN34_05925 [Cellulomonas sp. DKR-3]|uniref:Uncharacterized protein n=1 Tax=Cellulomonas fulva TaxID=2835530 RepID=A0ABS5TXG6_9CELL|nr:hypothetical protein [Cellulomonas fulva]MBT0993823.1 hypothetical protein [Cellulomonas fulva]
MGAAEIADPVAYAWYWTPIGVLLLLSVVWLPVLIVLLTRRRPGDRPPAPRPAPTPPAAATPTDPYAAARAAHLARIDDLERRVRAGEIDTRGLALGLRDVLRDFAAVRTGAATAAMTEADARRDPRVARIVSLLERTTSPAFGPVSRGSGKVALRDARQVVTTW